MSHSKPVEHLVGIFTSSKTSGDELCTYTMAVLNENNFSTRKIVGQKKHLGARRLKRASNAYRYSKPVACKTVTPSLCTV